MFDKLKITGLAKENCTVSTTAISILNQRRGLFGYTTVHSYSLFCGAKLQYSSLRHSISIHTTPPACRHHHTNILGGGSEDPFEVVFELNGLLLIFLFLTKLLFVVVVVGDGESLRLKELVVLNVVDSPSVVYTLRV